MELKPGLLRHVPAGIAVGDEVNARVEFGMEGGSRTFRGTVVWIHPEGRFFRVRFDFPKGSFHQSYVIPGRIESATWGEEPQTNVYRSWSWPGKYLTTGGCKK